MARRQFVSFPYSDLYKIKQQVLNWSVRFNTCCFLDSHEYSSPEHRFDCLAAVGERARLKSGSGKAFESLKKFSADQDDWLFGHFSFGLKSETENSPSCLVDFIGFPELFFYVPEIIVILDKQEMRIGMYDADHQKIYNEIMQADVKPVNPVFRLPVIQKRVARNEYLEIIQRLRNHIQRGDCYEINFCQEFFAEDVLLDPVTLFRSLNQVSPSPFSAYYSVDKKFLLCASPERYLRRRGERIMSQPIKGTAARDLKHPARDKSLREELAASEKDRAENVMVVDLVRNDLSKICKTDSVQVTELFGIYSFAQVHQMISTITGSLLPGLDWTEMIARTFPMGSMTGAPKKRVLELIELYEKSARGLFSGTLGYVEPNRDFDFNVVIRSLMYDSATHNLAYFAGSGITINSEPEKEYEECLLKVAAFEQIIKKPVTDLA